MHRLSFPDLVILMTIVLIFFLARRPRRPPMPPSHPLPAHERLSLFLRVKRRSADLWRF
jgi:hypothetical protein